MAFESHALALLDVQDHGVPCVLRREDGLVPCLIREFEERALVEALQPRKALSHLIGVDAAPANSRHFLGFPREDRRARELPEVGLGRHRQGLALPALREQIGDVERYPPKS
jgi:hypothetical protein